MLAVSSHDRSALAGALRRVAHEAGRIAERWFSEGERTAAQIWSKDGGSPVTEADYAVDRFLRTELAAIAPDAGWLSEESVDDLVRIEKREIWLVDPIDGTRAFLNGERDWSISIALVRDGRPVLGVVHAPALGALYEACAAGGATLNGDPISPSSVDRLAGARTAGPKPLVDAMERAAGTLVRLPKVPSLALRLARVAAGEIDVGLVSTAARDWDLVAADLIVTEAGGRLTTLAGAQPLYNATEPSHGILVAAAPRLHAQALRIMTQAFGDKA